MVKLRVILFAITILVVGIFGTLAFFYAKGFRFDPENGKISPQGLLVAKSLPDSAELYINGELKSATNVTLSLNPGNYDVKVKKAGYSEWQKRLTIEKEIVTEFTANLFKTTLSLNSVTEGGVLSPSISLDLLKIAYIVPYSENSRENAGLWVLENTNLPIGFLREPKRLTDGDLRESSYIWSPKGDEIMLTTKKGVYIVDVNKFTPQSQLINISASKDIVINGWVKDYEKIQANHMQGLPEKLTDVLNKSASEVVFSPDDDMILYRAGSDNKLEENIITPFPGASTQKEERSITKGKIYLYDIKEDKNFLIDDGNETIINGSFITNPLTTAKRSLTWYPSSRHLVLSEENKVIVMDQDGTNRQVVYSGSYSAPFAFPTQDPSKILILTNLGSIDTIPNFYSVSIK